MFLSALRALNYICVAILPLLRILRIKVSISTKISLPLIRVLVILWTTLQRSISLTSSVSLVTLTGLIILLIPLLGLLCLGLFLVLGFPKLGSFFFSLGQVIFCSDCSTNTIRDYCGWYFPTIYYCSYFGVKHH